MTSVKDAQCFFRRSIFLYEIIQLFGCNWSDHRKNQKSYISPFKVIYCPASLTCPMTNNALSDNLSHVPKSLYAACLFPPIHFYVPPEEPPRGRKFLPGFVPWPCCILDSATMHTYLCTQMFSERDQYCKNELTLHSADPFFENILHSFTIVKRRISMWVTLINLYLHSNTQRKKRLWIWMWQSFCSSASDPFPLSLLLQDDIFRAYSSALMQSRRGAPSITVPTHLQIDERQSVVLCTYPSTYSRPPVPPRLIHQHTRIVYYMQCKSARHGMRNVIQF